MKGLDSGVDRLRERRAPEMKTVGSCYDPGLVGSGGPSESWTQTGDAHPGRRCVTGTGCLLLSQATKHEGNRGTLPTSCLHCPLVPPAARSYQKPAKRDSMRVRKGSEGTSREGPSHTLKGRFVLCKEIMHQGQLWPGSAMLPQALSRYVFKNMSFARDT